MVRADRRSRWRRSCWAPCWSSSAAASTRAAIMVREPRAKALVNLVAKNNRRYGGYIIHVGVILAFIGIVGSSFFRTEVKKSVQAGDSFCDRTVQAALPGAGAERHAASGERDRAGRGAAPRRPRDRRDVAGQAVLQAPAAARDPGRDSLDAASRPLRRARRNRRRAETGDLPSLPDAAGLLAVGGRPDDGARHRHRDVAERARARRDCGRAQPSIHRRTRTRRELGAPGGD